MEEIKEGYTRVSDIIGQWDEFGHIDKKILSNKAEIGTRVHDCIEALCDGLPMSPQGRDLDYVKSWNLWFDTVQPKIVCREQRLYCDALKITGKFDALMEESSGLVLLDYKTSATASPKKWPLQGAFYHYLAKKNGFEVQDRVVFLQLQRDGSLPKIFEFQVTKDLMNVCISALNCYRYLKN